MYKSIFITFLSLSLWACQSSLPPLLKEDLGSAAPETFNITNQDQQVVGQAVHLEEDLFITPDHLLVSHKELFWETVPLTIVLRDFEHDILFFTLPGSLKTNHIFSQNPPPLGKKLHWQHQDVLTWGKVKALTGQFKTDQALHTKKQLLVLEGIIDMGDSGRPIFDEKGMIYGIIIAADRSKNEIYALRSDIVRNLQVENEL